MWFPWSFPALVAAGHWKIIEPVSGRIARKLDMVFWWFSGSRLGRRQEQQLSKSSRLWTPGNSPGFWLFGEFSTCWLISVCRLGEGCPSGCWRLCKHKGGIGQENDGRIRTRDAKTIIGIHKDRIPDSNDCRHVQLSLKKSWPNHNRAVAFWSTYLS